MFSVVAFLTDHTDDTVQITESMTRRWSLYQSMISRNLLVSGKVAKILTFVPCYS